MGIMREISTAVQTKDANAVRARILQLLAADLQAEHQGTTDLADSDLPPLPEAIDIGFELGDWLFENGNPELGAEIYTACFEKLRTSGSPPRLELARRLDRLAKNLIAVQRFEAAAKALEGSIELSRSAEHLDAQAFLWRHEKLLEMRQALADTQGAAAARAEYEKLKMRSGLGELGPDTWESLGRPPNFTIPGGRPSVSYHGVDDDGSSVPAPAAPSPTTDRYRSLADQIAAVPDGDAYHKVAVHFATHRQPHDVPPGGSYDPYDRYGHEASNTLNFGRAIVTVPVSRHIGEYEEPSSGFFGNGGALEESFTIQSVEIVGDQTRLVSDVATELSASEQQGGRKELLVFLHGYRTKLASGLMRAAQLKVDMKIEGSVVLYSLPSSGELWAYPRDRNAAADLLVAEHLRDFLISLSNDTGAHRVHLVAHSLGSEVLMRALNEIWKSGNPPPAKRFGEIIFAAPDVDHQDFINIVPRITDLCERVTVYASQRDLPLMLVSWLVDSSRAGFDPARLAGLANVDSIETTTNWWSSFWGNWGHWDFTEHAVDDVRAVVWLSLLPKGRARLIKPRQSDAGQPYWAVEIDTGHEFLRIALEWARRLELNVAIETITHAIAAERAMQPPGARLAEFEGIEAELQSFARHVRGSGVGHS